jgi:hypothetical protein
MMQVFCAIRVTLLANGSALALSAHWVQSMDWSTNAGIELEADLAQMSVADWDRILTVSLRRSDPSHAIEQSRLGLRDIRPTMPAREGLWH